MKRESCMLKIKPGMLMEIENAIRLQEENIQSALTSLGAMNASVWTVSGYLYISAEFADENPKGLEDALAPYNYDLSFAASYIAKPGEMRRMYHDIGIVREDKHLIRRRVFATHLKPDCAEEYYNRQFMEEHYEMMIDAGETTFKVHSTVMQPQGSTVGINIVPYNIHIMKPMAKEA